MTSTRADAPGRAGYARRPMHATTLTTVAILCAACAACAAPVAPDVADARVIVRFKPGTPDPAEPAFRAALARSARVGRIDFVRSMSGGAYVLQVGCDDGGAGRAKDPCAAAMERLGRTDAVLSIEADRRERIQ